MENIEKFFEKEVVVGNIANQISQRNLSDDDARLEKWLVTGPDKEGGIKPYADFSMLIAPDVSIARSHTSGLGSESETGTPQDSHPPQVNVISYPLCKVSDIRTIWKN